MAEHTPAARVLDCAMRKDCRERVSYIDDKGYVYCAPHGIARRGGGIRTRQLTTGEIKRLEAGEALARY